MIWIQIALPYLVTKTIIAQSTGLGCDGDSRPTAVLSQVRYTTAWETLSQESSRISRVSQGRDGTLHVGEGADEGGGVRDVIDGGGLDTEPADCHWDLTVGIALVCLS